MYQLYINKGDLAIDVRKITGPIRNSLTKKQLEHMEQFPESIVSFNSYYKVCLKRKPLIDLGREIKKKWENELKETLDIVKSIKI